MHWGLVSLSPAYTVHSLEPLAPYCPPAMEAGEVPITAAALASREPGFWLNGTPPPVGVH